MMQNLIDEDKLKRSQQNTWDTSLEYTKKYSFQIQLSMIYLQSRNISWKSNMSEMVMNQA